MQAIHTKYLAATDKRGARIKATAWAGSITVPYDHRLDSDKAHRKAAETLLVKLGWTESGHGPLATGCLPDQSYAHVLTGRDGKGD